MYIGKQYPVEAAIDVSGYWITDQAQLVPYVKNDASADAVIQLQLRKIDWEKMCSEGTDKVADVTQFVLKYLGWIKVQLSASMALIEFCEKRIAPRAINLCKRWLDSVSMQSELTAFRFLIADPKTNVISESTVEDSDKAKLTLDQNKVRQVMDPAIVTATRKRIAAYLSTVIGAAGLPFNPDSFLKRIEGVVELYLRPGLLTEKVVARGRIETMIQKLNVELAENEKTGKFSAKEIGKFLDKLEVILKKVPAEEGEVQEIKNTEGDDIDLNEPARQDDDDPDKERDWPDFGKGDWVYDMLTGHFAKVLNTPEETRVTVRFLLKTGWQQPTLIRNPVNRLGGVTGSQTVEINKLLRNAQGK